MRQRFLFHTNTIILALGLMLAGGCKEDSIIKASVAPGDNTLGTESIGDTMTVLTGTVFLNKAKTSEKIEGLPVIQALGTIVDPFFGKTNAGLYFQVLPTVNDFKFSAEGYTIDSAVLVLPYSGFAWGNRTDPKPQKLKVYRVNENMNVSADYYSNQDLQVNNEVLGEVTADLQQFLTDTPYVIDGVSAFKHLRIPLSNAFIADVRASVESGAVSSEEQFLNYFKGFYVAPDSSANMGNNTDLLPYILFDGGSDYSRVSIVFYYREDSKPTEVRAAFFNYIRDKTANYNRISRNYAGYPAASVAGSADRDTLLLQNEPGLAFDIKIPNISSIPASSIIKAELVFTVISSGVGADTFQMPNRITPVGIDVNGEEYEIADFISSDINAAVVFVDGAKKTEKDDMGNEVTRYRINVPRELQNAINDKRNELHLRIKGAKGFPGAYRLVAGGRGHSTHKMQLNIVYSKPK